jgi:GNAT superfamily N-acetyltransferase
MGLLFPAATYGYAARQKTTQAQREPRLARAYDLPLFLMLAREYVDEQEGDVVWGPKTEVFHRMFFEVGTVSICSNGFSAAGLEYPQDTPWGGRIAVGLGTYVRPAARRQGLSKRLRRLVLNRLEEDGYVGVMGMTSPSNGAGLASVQEVDRWRWHLLGQNGIMLLEKKEGA